MVHCLNKEKFSYNIYEIPVPKLELSNLKKKKQYDHSILILDSESHFSINSITSISCIFIW